jgi:hypothetical protein
MEYRKIDANGVLRELWVDQSRTYTAWDENGVQTVSRAYNAEENARADANATYQSEEGNRQTIEAALFNGLTELDTIINTANNQLGAAAIKTLARILRRVIRLLIRRFDGTT